MIHVFQIPIGVEVEDFGEVVDQNRPDFERFSDVGDGHRVEVVCGKNQIGLFMIEITHDVLGDSIEKQFIDLDIHRSGDEIEGLNALGQLGMIQQILPQLLVGFIQVRASQILHEVENLDLVLARKNLLQGFLHRQGGCFVPAAGLDHCEMYLLHLRRANSPSSLDAPNMRL